MIDNKDSKKRYRADNLLEDRIAKYEKEGKNDKASRLQEQMDTYLKADDLAGLKQLIEEHEIACPVSGTRNWTDVRQFNLMFSTQMGATAGDSDVVYLRPETAQGIRSQEHTSELQSLMRTSHAVFCLKKNNHKTPTSDNLLI